MPKIPAEKPKSRAEIEKDKIRAQQAKKQARAERRKAKAVPPWAAVIILLLIFGGGGGALYLYQQHKAAEREADSLEHLLEMRDSKRRFLQTIYEIRRLGGDNYSEILDAESELEALKRKIEVLKAK